MPSYTQYRDSSDTTRTPSPVIWADCPTAEIAHNPAAGYHFFDDFIGFPTFAEADDVAADLGQNYRASGSDGVTCVNSTAGDDFGIIRVAGNDAAEDGFTLVHGNSRGGYARMGAGASDRVWFEARFRTSNITIDVLNVFIGLYEMTVDPTSVIAQVNGTGIPNTTEDYVGFLTTATDTGTMEAFYQEGGATSVDVGRINTILAVDTFFKVGMRYRGGAGANGGGVLDYYLDGALVQTLDITTALAFPDVNHMAMLLAVKSTLGTAYNFDLDWWRVAAVGGNT
ncbi:MAG: hypothetical protein E2O95_04810 [Acidobacteria bacterium]|nr:MAG: hypothetical protein E2O95_04810 [Acidobacteriota bacterium]